MSGISLDFYKAPVASGCLSQHSLGFPHLGQGAGPGSVALAGSTAVLICISPDAQVSRTPRSHDIYRDTFVCG